MADGPVPWLGPIASLASRVYLRELQRRNRAFDSGVGVARVDRPVISIGNLSVGGTGKTPMVRWLASRLLEAGRRPCIAMRGYARRKGEQSDEEAEYLRTLPGVAVVAQPDRASGLRARFTADPTLNVVILDDGFQHRRLARDLDIVLVDASRSPFADRPLPVGWLREPVESLRRAHAVVITHAEMAAPGELTALEAAITAAHGKPAVARTRHEWTALIDAAGCEHPVDALAGKRILALSAIGNPHAFLRRAEVAAGSVEPFTLADHAHYSPRTVRRIVAQARALDAILTTEKDWSKLASLPADTWPCPIFRARLDMQFDSGEDALWALVRQALAEGSAPATAAALPSAPVHSGDRENASSAPCPADPEPTPTLPKHDQEGSA